MSSGRRPMIAGNWKMNTTQSEAHALASAIAASPAHDFDVVVCPPFPWLLPVRDALAGSNVRLGAQDCWPRPNGAFTGAVSVEMLRELVSHVIVGHSERRQVFGESDQLVREKITSVLAAGLTPIVCVGESLAVRESGSAQAFVAAQLSSAFSDRPIEECTACVIAYEPIWAIGTGVAASADDAESMAVGIRETLDAIQPGVSSEIRVLYGGSVTPAKSAEMLGQPNVDGALVGGASLKSDSFLEIIGSITR
jgi:triosephosphate isomerase (TIM)